MGSKNQDVVVMHSTTAIMSHAHHHGHGNFTDHGFIEVFILYSGAGKCALFAGESLEFH